MSNDKLIKKEYKDYLMTRCGFSYASASSYISALNSVVKLLESYGCDGFYSIRNLHDLLDVKTYATTLDEFEYLNLKHHHSCSCSLTHYYDFAASNRKFSHVWNRPVRI